MLNRSASSLSLTVAFAFAFPTGVTSAQVQKVEPDYCIAVPSGNSFGLSFDLQRPAVFLENGILCLGGGSTSLSLLGVPEFPVTVNSAKVDPRTIRVLGMGDFVLSASKSILKLESEKASRQELVALQNKIEAASAKQSASNRSNLEAVVRRLSEVPAEFAMQPEVLEVVRSSLLSDLTSDPVLRNAIQRAVIEWIRTDPEFRKSLSSVIASQATEGTK